VSFQKSIGSAIFLSELAAFVNTFNATFVQAFCDADRPTVSIAFIGSDCVAIAPTFDSAKDTAICDTLRAAELSAF
jgi:hypothetical protein